LNVETGTKSELKRSLLEYVANEPEKKAP